MIVIDSDNYAAAGITTMSFPGGEPHCKLAKKIDGSVLLVLKLRTETDILRGACVKDMLYRNGAIDKLYVFMPYFPGARQDRTSLGRAPFTLDVMCDLFQPSMSARFDVFDIHSEAGIFSVRPDHNWMPTDLAIPIRPGIVGIIAPDKGAASRADSFRNHFYPDAHVVQCEKHRDPDTGDLSGYTMPPLPEAGNYIIVDDICDGGWTFNLLAAQFFADPLAGALELFVSHGIFSKGLAAIDSGIQHITTTDSWLYPGRYAGYPRLNVIKLDQLYSKITG